MGISLSLKRKFVEKTIVEANKRGTKRYSGEDKPENWLLWEFDDEKPEIEIDLDNNSIAVTSYNTPIGTIDVSIDLTAEIQIDLLEMFVKRLNKIKAMMESLR